MRPEYVTYARRESTLRSRRVGSRSYDFDHLYRESYSKVYNYAYYQLLNADAAEDVTAEAFLKAARAFDSFNPKLASFSTWVIAIERNCVIDYLRKSKPTTNIEDIAEGFFASEDGEYKHVEDADLTRHLLAQLDESERELVFLKYYADMRNVDIAAQTGVNESTVATRLARSIAKMRASL